MYIYCVDMKVLFAVPQCMNAYGLRSAMSWMIF